jgi:hypothetical protein
MRKLIVMLTATAAFLCIGSLTWRAEAAPWLAALRSAAPAKRPRRFKRSAAGRGSGTIAHTT